MALDPQIALGVRVPQIALPQFQIQSPLERFQRVQSLRNLMAQGQLQQMNLEQTQLENEALRRTAQEQQSLGSWMQQLPQEQRQNLTAQDITAAHPNPTGLKFATAWSTQQTGALTQYKASLDAAHEKAKAEDRIYNSVTPGDKQSKLAALAELVRLKTITGDQAAQIAGLPDEEFAKLQQQAAAASLDRLQRIDAEKKAIDLRIAKATEPSAIQKVIDEATKAKQEATGTQPITPYQQAQLEQGKYGKTEPYPQPVQTQKVEEAAAMAGARTNVLQTPEKISQDLEIERRKLTQQNELNVNKAMSGDAAKVYAIATTIQPELEALRAAFKKDYKGTLRGILLGTDPNVSKIAKNAADKVGRIRSGGAVNPSEEQRFMSAIASKSDVLFGNLDATLAALDRYALEAKTVEDNLRPKHGGPNVPPPPTGQKVKVWNEQTGRFEER